MAVLLARGDPDAALGAKGVPCLLMQQITAAHFTIPLALFKFGLTMGAFGHLDLQTSIDY